MEYNFLVFMEELAELTKKTGVEISGCGCCGSPYMIGENLEGRTITYDRLKYNEKTQKYELEEY